MGVGDGFRMQVFRVWVRVFRDEMGKGGRGGEGMQVSRDKIGEGGWMGCRNLEIVLSDAQLGDNAPVQPPPARGASRPHQGDSP